MKEQRKEEGTGQEEQEQQQGSAEEETHPQLRVLRKVVKMCRRRPSSVEQEQWMPSG